MTADLDEELAARFLARWPEDTPGPPELGAQLREVHAAAQAAWPDLDVGAEQLAGYLGERADVARPPDQALAALASDDLYLACACARQVPTALAAFEAHHLAALDGVVGRIDPSPAFADELKQLLRVRLMVGSEDGFPTILQYRGQGSLRGWLGVVATRAALELKRGGEQRQVDLEEVVLQASSDTPELRYLRGQHLHDVRQDTRLAVAEALAQLAPAERNLLRWHLVDNVSLRKIAVARGTYVVAVAREYAKIRAGILDRVRQKVQTRIGLSPAEADSLLAALASRISITLGRLLESQPAGLSISLLQARRPPS
jgi:RNA polymerase sigma-70 factor, ECF subfamily